MYTTIPKLYVLFFTKFIQSSSMLKWGYDLLVTVMIGYFIISIMNTMAQNSMARQQKAIREKKMDTRSK